MAMIPDDHMRDPENRYKSLCGLGYDYPSTISLTDVADDVTCQQCLTAWFGIEEGKRMDPNKTLNRLRQWVKEVLEDRTHEIDEEDAANLFDSLDQWMTNGGFAPNDWTE